MLANRFLVAVAVLLLCAVSVRAEESSPAGDATKPSEQPPAATPVLPELAPAEEKAPAATPEKSKEEPTAVTPSPTPAAEPAALVPSPVPVASAPPAPPILAPVGPQGHVARFEYEIHGFVRAGYTYVMRDEGSFAVGQNSGFRLVNTRMNLVGGYGELLAFDLSLDHEAPLDPQTNGAPFHLAPRDASLDLKWKGGLLRIGQFKTPFNGEFLLSDSDVPFARRSIVSDGIAGDESRTAYSGMGLDRQIGLMASHRLELGGPSVEFSVGAFNGNGMNQGRNDNRAVAVAGRVALSISGNIVGVSGFWNDRTLGYLTTLQDERDLSGEADVLLHLAGVKAFGMFAITRTGFLSAPSISSRNSMGAVGAVSYPLDVSGTVVEPAYRFAYFSPTNLLDNTDLIDHTIGVNFYPWNLPLRIQLNGTIRLERDSRSAPNNLFEAILQGNF